jgi:type II secretory pathway pseudopilin PulG
MSNKLDKNEGGFSLIEAVVALMIITIGLLGTAAAITSALQFGATSRNVSQSKLIIFASVEEIESIRNTRRLDFKQIANVGSVDNTNAPNTFSGFSSGFKEISLSPGPDGVNGTDDDLNDAGPDGVFGTSDDFKNQALAKSGYTRQITVTNLSASLKKVEIRVRYFTSTGKMGELAGVCYLNDDARITR